MARVNQGYLHFLLVKIVMYIGWNPHFWVRLPLSSLFWSNPTTVGYVGIFLPVTVIFWLHTHIYIYSRFVVGYTLIFRIYLSPFLLVMCSCVNPRKEFEQHFCWIWYITWQYMTSIFFWVNTLPIGHQAMLYEIFNSVGPVASIRVCRDSVSRKPGDLGTWRFMWPEIRAVAAKP